MFSRIFSVLFLFSCLLTYFVFCNGWYVPSQLIIKGTVPDHSADIQVQWDSGAGFNGYESNRFLINALPDKEGTHQIQITALGEKHPHSESTAIEIHSLSIDGKKVQLSKIMPRSILHDRLAIHLKNKGESFQLKTKAKEHIEIELVTSDYFGKVEVTIDGVSKVYDLYSGRPRIDILKLDSWVVSENGQFTIAMDIPRYPIDELVIKNNDQSGGKTILDSATLVSDLGVKELTVNRGEILTSVSFSELNKSLQRYLHSSRLLLQIFFAALTTWIVLACYGVYQKAGGFAGLFILKRRYLFWLFFIGGVVSYSLWLAAFWPGVMSIDSLKIWRAAAIPGVFINDHPVLNVVFYRFLMQIWNNVAVIPVTQILLVSLLVAYVFFFLFRQGVSLLLLVPCYLFVLCSIPVGLYTIVLWKDIPFALVLVFWGITLVRLRVAHRTGTLKVSFSNAFALFLLYLASGLFRHNGIIYLAVVPVFIILLRLFNLKKVFVVTLACLLTVGSLFLILQNSKAMEGGKFFYFTARSYVKSFSKKSLSEEVVRTAKEYPEIFDMNKAGTKSDRWHYYLHDRSAYEFLRITGWNDFYPYVGKAPPFPELRRLALKLYNKSYEKPWLYVTWNPVYMLFVIPLCLCFFRWLPHAALYGGFLFIGAIALVFLQTFNWRYYYFYYLGLYFILPMIFLDLKIQRDRLWVEDK